MGLRLSCLKGKREALPWGEGAQEGSGSGKAGPGTPRRRGNHPYSSPVRSRCSISVCSESVPSSGPFFHWWLSSGEGRSALGLDFTPRGVLWARRAEGGRPQHPGPAVGQTGERLAG